MIPHCVVPIHEFVKIFELETIFLVRIIPFFDLAIRLWMLDATFDVVDIILPQKCLEFAVALPILVGLVSVKLASMISNNLFYSSYLSEVIQYFLDKTDAVFCGRFIEFVASEDAS